MSFDKILENVPFEQRYVEISIVSVILAMGLKRDSGGGSLSIEIDRDGFRKRDETY